MRYTPEEKQVILNRLRKNISNLKEVTLYLEEDEKESFYVYLLLTLNYGLDNCVENAFTFNTNGFKKHDIGTRYEVCVGDTLDSLATEPERTVSIVHNHPDSILPSDDDIDIFFRHRILKNTAVCGNIGNLYFMQKGLDFHYLIKSEDLPYLKDKIWKLFKIKMQTYARERGETPEGLRAKPENVKKDYFRSITDIIYCDICRMIQKYDDGFQFYSEGVVFSG